MKHVVKTIRVIFWICGALTLYGIGALFFQTKELPLLGLAGLAIVFTALVAIWIYIAPAYCIASVSDFVQIKPARIDKIIVAIFSMAMAAIGFIIIMLAPIENQYYAKVALAFSAALFGFICGLYWSTLDAYDLIIVKRDMETLKKSGFWHLP